MVDLSQALAVIAKVKPQVVFITGPSGCGKDRVAELIINQKGDLPLVPIYADSFGSADSGSWLVEVEELTHAIGLEVEKTNVPVVIGTSDNWGDTVLAVTGLGAICFFVRPDHFLWVQAQAAKAKDYKGDRADWLAGWNEKASMNKMEFEKYISAKETLYSKWWNDAKSFFVLDNSFDGTEVTAGWHQKR